MGPKKGHHKEEVHETPDQIEWRKLKNEADRMYAATQKEDRDFNEFQQQREKLNYFWIVEKKKLDDQRAALRNKTRELQDLEEKHQVEIKMHKQRLKHLLHEHQDDLGHKKYNTEVANKVAQEDNAELESIIKDEKRLQTQAVREVEVNHEEYIRALKRAQDEAITNLRHEFERVSNETQKSYDSRMKVTREKLDAKRQAEIKRIEDAKSARITELLDEHQRAFADIKNYYNDITHNNLDLIKSLKEEVKELERDEKKSMARLQEKMVENRRLSAPLKKMQEDVLRLRSELGDYNEEKKEMRRVKAALLVVEGHESTLEWERETLLQRYSELVKERDQLKESFMTSMFDVKQKSGFKGLLLEKKLSAMARVQQEREAQLDEVLAKANVDASLLGNVKASSGDVIAAKNREARSLQTEVSRLQALHAQLQRSVEQKLKEYGMTVAELGFEATSVKKLAKTGSSTMNLSVSQSVNFMN
jgi:hypothetical protein